MKKYYMRALLAGFLSGCWNGVPFQVDLVAKSTIDYPDGDPRKGGSAFTSLLPTASGSVREPGTAANGLYGLFPDYDIPRTDVKVLSSIVLQPRGQYPPQVESFRVLRELKEEMPQTIWVRTAVGLAYKNGAHLSHDGTLPHNYSDYSTFEAPDIGQNGALLKKQAAEIRFRSFDGSYDRTYLQTTNAFYWTDGHPVYKPMFVQATVNGYTGYSLPFILAPSQRDITGLFIPVQSDVLITF